MLTAKENDTPYTKRQATCWWSDTYYIIVLICHLQTHNILLLYAKGCYYHRGWR